MSKRLTIFFATIVAIIPLQTMALIVKLTDLQSMAKRSDLVIHGYVGEQTVTTDDLGRNITLTELEVVDGLLGAKTGDIITVYQVGGQKDGIVMPLLGGHSYKLGQEVILFGLQMGDAYVSYGAGQGKLDIFNEHGEELVMEDLGDISVIDVSNDHTEVRPSPLRYESSALLKDEIKAMIVAK